MAGIISRLTNTGNYLVNGVFDEFTGVTVTDGLVLHIDASQTTSYPGTGTTWNDLSGNGRNGTLVNGPSFNTLSGGGITFDGVDDYADFPIPTIPSTITIDAFIKWNSINGGMFLGYTSYDVFTNGGALGYNNANSNLIGISAATVTSLGLVGNWHHYTFVMNNSGLMSLNKIYIDGVAQTLSVILGADGAAPAIGNTLRLSGWLNGGYSCPITYGSMRAYNRELTVTEIRKNFNAQAYRYGLAKIAGVGASTSVQQTGIYVSELDEVTKPTPSTVAKRELSTGVVQVKGEFDEVTGAPITDGLVLYLDAMVPASYPGTGTTWTDLSGYGNNGTLFNSPTYSNAAGGFFTFNGSNSFVSVPNSASLNPGSSNWTVSIWFNATSAALAGTYGGPILYNKENLYEGSVGGSVVEIAWQPSWAWYGTTPTLSAGVWYHTVHTYDGSTQRIYLNGVQTWSQPMTGVIGSNTNDLGIGCRGLSGGAGAGASAFFAGSVSMFSMYNRALTATEIQQNFNAQRGRFGI